MSNFFSGGLKPIFSNLFYPNSRTDRVTAILPTTPTLSSVNSVWSDVDFGNRIVRVTSDTVDSGRSFHVASNAHKSCWTADSSKFYGTNNGGGIFTWSLDSNTMQVVPLSNQPYSQTEPSFSRVNPDAMYTIGGSNVRTIRKYSMANNSFVDVIDHDSLGYSLISPQTYIGGIDISTVPEILLTYFGGQGQDAHYLLMWYPLTNPSVKKILDTTASTINGSSVGTTLNFQIHAAAIDQSGRYVTIYPRGPDISTVGQGGNGRLASQVYVWDTNVDVITPITGYVDGGPNYYPTGHDSLGYETWVNADQGGHGLAYDNLQWQFRYFLDITTHYDLIDPPMSPTGATSIAEHSSWNNAKPNEKKPVLSSTFRYNDTRAWRAWDDEIIAINTDPTQSTKVWRFCHHFSDVESELNPAIPYFSYQPIANISPDGTHAIFVSNWRKTLGADSFDPPHNRTDIYCVELK